MTFGLIALVLILTPKYLKWISPPQPEQPTIEEVLPNVTSPEIAIEQVIREETAQDIAHESRTVEEDIPSAVPERVITIDTPLYKAEISSFGGGSIKSFILKDYPSRYKDGLVQLISNETTHPNLGIAYIDLNGDSVYLDNSFKLTSDGVRDIIQLDKGSTRLEYTHTLPSGATVTKQIAFNADSYSMPLDITWTSQGLELGLNSYEVHWFDGLAPAEKLLKEDETYGKVYIYQGGVIEDQGSLGKGTLERKPFTGNTGWVAMRNKYFAAAFISDPDAPGTYGAFSAYTHPVPTPGNGPKTLTRYNMALGQAGVNQVHMELYLGPLSYSRIKGLGVDLDRIMNLGVSIIRPISKGVLFALVNLYKVIPNYGLVLILFALMIRIVTNPLTKKSALSTQKMQLVQPRVKELQEKYKGNPQKLNTEMMALWKSEGVNPFGGCLPILIQMPLLWALFIVFRTTIELRGAPFALWVTDLSLPDVVFTLPFSIPLYGDGVTILALIMGITMFLQQKLSGAASNPQQKPMMYMMTGMFFLIFNTFPSGLNLYYAFSNFLAILQQRNIKKQLAAGTA
jgi:YidC/Oxa1 family membrane protein insertase